MQAIGGYFTAREALRELSSEQDVRQLGGGVDIDRSIAQLRLQIVEVQPILDAPMGI